MTKSVKANTEAVTETPRAVVHKQILEVAEQNPDSSLERLAAKVSGANVDLVERVLETYGDPAEPPTIAEESDRSDSNELLETSIEETMPETEGPQIEFSTNQNQLTEKQLETLRTVREHPGATQAELAELLGVSSATINTRVNSIDGFDWEQRHDFVEQVITDVPDSNASEQSMPERDALDERLRNLEENVEHLRNELVAEKSQAKPFDADPELSHKILHACLASDHIGEEEELDIVKEFID